MRAVLLPATMKLPLSAGASFDGAGDELTLIVDGNAGLVGGPIDAKAKFGDWPAIVGHLGENGWLRIDQQGRVWRIALGERTLAALR